ncbi:uncharacterized protein LOC116118334, partial [Pistacia vera]|uniref:uncharacterized protein LOC116118334 n=1 Tax=Pistacia vera TaxID=55513 RepID=UPI001262C35A
CFVPCNLYWHCLNFLFISAKLICKLTGDTVNKTEEHIWKHINGKRFLNKLEQKETEKLESNGTTVEEEAKTSTNSVNRKNKKKKKGKEIEEIISEVRESPDKESDLEEADFWMPPVGERWDHDDGGDRWGSGSESGEESDEENETGLFRLCAGQKYFLLLYSTFLYGVVEDGTRESEELSARTKRMSIEIGPSSFASRKKKSRKDKS